MVDEVTTTLYKTAVGALSALGELAGTAETTTFSPPKAKEG
jgi:hypothetical protein